MTQSAPKPRVARATTATVGRRSRKSVRVPRTCITAAAAPKASTMARTTQRPWRRRRMASIVHATICATEVAAATQSRITIWAGTTASRGSA